MAAQIFVFALEAADLPGRIGKGHSATAFRLRRSGLRCAPLAESFVSPGSKCVGSNAQFGGHPLERSAAAEQQIDGFRSEVDVVGGMCFWHVRCHF
jgi:hypothetical protein